MAIIRNAEGYNVIEEKAIRLLREHFEKENSRYSLEVLDTAVFKGALVEFRTLKVRRKDDRERAAAYTISHNHFEGNSVSVYSDALMNVPKDRGAAALRAINAFNSESCACLVMDEIDSASIVRLTGCIPDETADEDVVKVVEDLIALLEDECGPALSSLHPADSAD